MSFIKNFNQKCTDLVACARENRCDVDWKIPDFIIACYCGKDVTADECFAGKRIEGPCVAEYEAATGAPPGDYRTVSDLAVDLTLPSGYAYYLASCQREFCFKECR